MAVCKFNKFGFCRYGNLCFRKHENRKCENDNCQVKGCPYRHPRKCRYYIEYNNCKFGSYCKFSHDVIPLKKHNEEINDLKKQIKDLKKEINEKDTKDNDDDTMTDYSLIDCAGQVPRSLTCSPLSLPSLLAGPDLVQDLPMYSGNKVTRTSSQVQGNKYRLMSGEMQNAEKQAMMEREDVCDRQSGRRPLLKRSVSALPERLKG